MKKQLLFLTMMLLPMMASADDNGSCGDNVSWIYTVETQTLTISGMGEMMDFSLKNIPWKAYSESIKAVIIEEGVTHIGSGAFYGCENLTSVDIPQSVTTIGGRPFGNCKSLTSITIPSSVTSIGAYAFDNCSSLNKVNISSLSAWCKIKFEDRISNPLSWARYLYLNDELVEDLIIPDEVLNIGDYSFYACDGLKSVTFHDGVTSIGKSSFQSCERITSINVPNNVNQIGSYAFAGCSKLSSIKIPNNINVISEGLFSACISLSEFTIPTSVTSIEKEAFSLCENLVSIDIPYGISSINENTFYSCKRLSKVTIPTSVTSIGKSSFYNCRLLASIEIPDGVILIDDLAFRDCVNLQTIILPSTLKSINQKVFYGCKLLNQINIFASNPPSLYDDTFSVYSATVKVPKGCKEKYANASVWKYFAQIVESYKYNLIYKVDNEIYKTYEIEEGTAITSEPAPTKEGYTFSGWSEIPQTMPAHDVTVTGTFTINKYKLTYTVDNEVYKTFEIEYAKAITPESAPTKEGYTFSGWSEIPATMPANDVTVTGTFAINKYKLTYKVDGEVYKTYEIEYGKAITPEAAPTKEGYTFSGWSEILETMPANDVTVTGTFTINKYKLTYMVDGEEYKSYEIEYGAKITPEAEPTKEGYSFSGWSSIPETMPAKDVVITGTFTKGAYKLTYMVDGEVYKTVSYDFGATITPENAPTKEGYTFSGWSEIPATMPAKDVTIIGTFTINKYELTYMVDGAEYKSYDIEYGATITPEAAPTKEGYTFSGWSEIPQTMPAKDVTVTGTFTVNKYKLTYMVDGAEYKSYEIEYGAKITPETEPIKEGYSFSGWSSIPEIMPAKDVVVTGTFSKGSYKLTYMVDGAVYKTVSYDYGDRITPEAAPTKEGYTFSGWSNIPATMPAKDVTVTGTFTINKYKLTYKVDGEIYKTYEIEYGKAITPEAEPTKEGYTFSGWNEIPSTMPAHDVEVMGTFIQVEFVIDDVTYEISGEGTVTIKGSDQKGEVTIDATVVINGQTYRVTAIADNAFKENQSITSVTIPDGINTIGDNAFNGCIGLIVIIIGKDVQTIGNKAFANVGTASAARTRSEESMLIVNCYAESVPQTASDAFENTPIENGTLMVEDNSVNAYKATSPWSRFGRIMGFEEAVGINTISIDSANARIYDMQGNRLDNPQKGVNIIRYKDGKVKKVMVK